MRNLRIKTFALLATILTVLTAASVYAYYAAVPGIAQIYVSDPPTYSSDIQHIYVTFYRVELHRVQGDGWFQVAGDLLVTVDLMTVLNSSQLLATRQIPQGTYDMVRITLIYTQVVIGQNGTETVYVLDMPSALRNGMKVSLSSDLVVTAGSNNGILIDMTLNNGDLHRFIMTPSIVARLVSKSGT